MFGNDPHCFVARCLGAGVAASALLARFADAREPLSSPAAGESQTLGEVIVTAQRREENLQRVPIAVTAVPSEELERRQILSLQGVQYVAPNLVISPTFANSMTSTISMRGLSEFDIVPTYDPAVGLYLDGVYIARVSGANLDLVDMDRVEVLRGPQGTLFGRNTTGGAINLIPNKPTRDLEGSLRAAVGNYSRVELTGVLNVPFEFQDGALRIAARHVEHGGYGDAVLLGEDLSDDDTNFVRAQLRLVPVEEWTADLSFDLTSVHRDSQLMTAVAAFEPATQLPALAGNPTDSLGNYIHPADREVRANRAGAFDARVWGTALELAGELGGLAIKSISAWRELDQQIANADYDGSPYDVLGQIRRVQAEHQFSQELQVHGAALEDRLDWTAGVLYFGETAGFETLTVALAPLVTGQTLLRGTANNDSWAAYLQLTDAITPTVRLTAGARYNVDWRQLTSRNARVVAGQEICSLASELVDSAGLCQATLPERKFSYVPFTFGIDYTPASNWLLYAKVSRGQRAGGYNMRGGTPLDLLTFGPEQVISYEAGAKADLFAQRVRVDLALFYSDYSDIQLVQLASNPVQGLTIIKQNAGQAWIEGGELEVTALLGRMRLTGALGVAHGEYTQLEPGVQDLRVGQQFVRPTTTFSLGADLPIAFESGQLELHLDYSGHNDDLGLEDRCACDNAYALLNATASFRFRRANLELGVWGRNLRDEHYMAQAVDFDFLVSGIPGDPRTYGVSLTYTF